MDQSKAPEKTQQELFMEARELIYQITGERLPTNPEGFFFNWTESGKYTVAWW